VQRIKNLAPIFLILISFFVLRLLLPHSLNNDEAEQVLAAQEFVLGYPKQPPLYSWLVRSISIVLGYDLANIYILNGLKFFFFAVFIYFLYLSAELIFTDEFYQGRSTERISLSCNPAFLILSGILLFISYFYDFMRDLTHSILAAMFSSVAFYVYLKLWLKPNLFKYIVLGIVFGLGMLSKYNFIFFALSMVAASLVERKAFQLLFNWRSLLSLISCILVFSPNLFYLAEMKLSAVNYALERSAIANTTLTQFTWWNLLKLPLMAFYEIIMVISILILIFYPVVKWERVRNYFFTDDLLVTAKLRRYIFFLGLFSILIPLLIMFATAATKFYAKWLSVSSFLVVFSFFTLIDFKLLLTRTDFQIRKFVLYLIVIGCFIASALVFIIAGFYPDLIGRVAKTQYPYVNIAKLLREKYPAKVYFTANNDPVLEANLILAFTKDNEKTEIKASRDVSPGIYVWDAKLYGHNPQKVFLKNNKRNLETVSQAIAGFPLDLKSLSCKVYKLNYINSRKQYYELGVCEIPSLE